jgi:hypothetical protein
MIRLEILYHYPVVETPVILPDAYGRYTTHKQPG